MGEAKPGLEWQSKAILLIVVPWTAISVLLQSYWWGREAPVVMWTTLGISGVFGLVVWRLRAGTFGAAATGAAVTASLMYSTTRFPYATSWLHGGLMPLLAVFLLTFAATKIGKNKKERLGTGEDKRGRNAAQVAANLGIAALVARTSPILLHMLSGLESAARWEDWELYFGSTVALAVLAEAAADTVSSEIGQVFGGKPRMITTLREVRPGTDGGITVLGTVAGLVAAAVVSAVGGWLMIGDRVILPTLVAATFGLLFDSLLGATLERKGWLGNDAVNFLSTLSTSIFLVAEYLIFFRFFFSS